MPRSFASRLGAAGVVVLTSVAGAMAARPPCPDGTYVVQGGPLLFGAPPTQVDTIAVSPDPATVSLSIGCGPANAVKTDKVRGVKKGTKVRATWQGCAGLAGKIKLRGIVVDECGRMTGKLRAKGLKRRFEALDAGSGGPCDPVAAPGSQGCTAGQKCTWVQVQDVPEPIGTTTCVPDGTQDLGDACTIGPAGETTGFDDCKAGLVCIGGACADVCGFDGTPQAQCAPGYNCTRYSGLFANGEDDPAAGACSEGCNPLTQLRTSGGPCGENQGCYLLTGQTDTISVCAGAGSVAVGETITGTTFANSCVPGAQPRAVAGGGNPECGALCQMTDVYLGHNEADEGGVAPYTCQAAGAAAPDDPTDGESCRYWWARESFDGLSQFSNSLGWCFKHAAFQYDSDGDQTPDTPFPRCITLTTGDVVPPIFNPALSDAEYFWCTALPEAPALRTDRMRGAR